MKTYGGAYLDTARALRAAGVRDPEEIRRHSVAAAQAVVAEETPWTALMVLTGRTTSRVVGRFVPRSAGRGLRVVSTTGAAIVANVATSTILNRIRSGEWETNIQQLTSDALFGIFHARGEWKAARPQDQHRADAELLRRKQVYEAAPTHVRQKALLDAIRDLPPAERHLLHHAHAQRKPGRVLTPDEQLAFEKATRNAAERLAGMRSRIPTTPPADVIEYSDRYFKAVAGKPQDISDLVAEAHAMVKNYPAGRNFQIDYNAPRGSELSGTHILLRPEPRRIGFHEELSHWRMKYGDRFLAQEKKDFLREVKLRRLPLERTTAEELAVKTYLINNHKQLGLEPVDVEYLNHQIRSLWKYGATWY